MSNIYIQKEIRHAKELFSINESLKNWNFKLVEGEGFFQYMEKYSHIKLKMYKSTGEDANSNKIISNLDDKLFPESYYKIPVKLAFEFFIPYLEALRGEDINLTVEITDGSYHEVDSQPRHYMIATIYAIINCFDKEFNKLKPFQEEAILRCKKHAEEL